MCVFVLKKYWSSDQEYWSSDQASGYIPRSGAGEDKRGAAMHTYQGQEQV